MGGANHDRTQKGGSPGLCPPTAAEHGRTFRKESKVRNTVISRLREEETTRPQEKKRVWKNEDPKHNRRTSDR